jgi:thioester reductase-like protein
MSQKLWAQVRGTDETTSFSRLRHLLNFRSHPDVQTGRRYE